MLLENLSIFHWSKANRIFTSRPQDRTLVCSRCHLVVPVPAKGIEAFPLNFFINNMLTVLAVQNPTKCTNCEDSSQATARCLDCVENLCTNCVFAHKRIRQTKDHRILTFEEIQANEVKDIIRCPSFCSVHPREVLLSFLFSRWLESASHTQGIWRLFLPGSEEIWSPLIGGGEFDR